MVSATGGEPRLVLSQAQVIFGLCWTADGRETVYSSAKSDLAKRVCGECRCPEDFPGAWPKENTRGLPRFPARHPIGVYPKNQRHKYLAGTGAGDYGQQDPATKLIPSTRIDAVPALSPDGKKVAFVSYRSGTPQVWVCDRDGSNAKQLTSFPEPGAGLPAWSPDGRQIAFDSSVGGSWDVYVIAAHGGAPRQLTAESTFEGASNWSRDGRWIYFGSDRSGKFEIWKVPAQGGTAVQVTKTGGHKPVASADGDLFITKSRGLSTTPGRCRWKEKRRRS